MYCSDKRSFWSSDPEDLYWNAGEGDVHSMSRSFMDKDRGPLRWRKQGASLKHVLLVNPIVRYKGRFYDRRGIMKYVEKWCRERLRGIERPNVVFPDPLEDRNAEDVFLDNEIVCMTGVNL